MLTEAAIMDIDVRDPRKWLKDRPAAADPISDLPEGLGRAGKISRI